MSAQLPKKILFVYCAAASLFITINGLLTASSIESIVFTALFIPVTLYFVLNTIKIIRNSILAPNPSQKTKKDPQLKINKTELTIATVLLLGLTAIGIISVSSNRANPPTTNLPDNAESIIEQEKSEPLKFEGKEVVVTKTVEIVIEDGSPFVNIREKPTVYSEAIGQAEDSKVYELIEEDAGWYKIKFDDVEGFISIKYAEVTEK